MRIISFFHVRYSIYKNHGQNIINTIEKILKFITVLYNFIIWRFYIKQIFSVILVISNNGIGYKIWYNIYIHTKNFFVSHVDNKIIICTIKCIILNSVCILESHIILIFPEYVWLILKKNYRKYAKKYSLFYIKFWNYLPYKLMIVWKWIINVKR